MFNPHETLRRVIDAIMYNNSFGVKGAKFSCELTSYIYENFQGDERDALLEFSESFLITDYGYKMLEYNDGKKVFFYK